MSICRARACRYYSTGNAAAAPPAPRATRHPGQARCVSFHREAFAATANRRGVRRHTARAGGRHLAPGGPWSLGREGGCIHPTPEIPTRSGPCPHPRPCCAPRSRSVPCWAPPPRRRASASETPPRLHPRHGARPVRPPRPRSHAAPGPIPRPPLASPARARLATAARTQPPPWAASTRLGVTTCPGGAQHTCAGRHRAPSSRGPSSAQPARASPPCGPPSG